MSPEEPRDSLPTREEVLGGFPARRAAALLFLVESRTAHLVARSRQAAERFLTEDVAAERDLAFIEAFSAGRDAPRQPTVQDLERFARSWAPLVPANVAMRAALARLLGQKYRLEHAATPAIRAAVGLDDPAVQAAYLRQHHEPLGSLYVTRRSPRERVRWAMAAGGRWLEELPPFWTAFALTLTETVGASILALPIALAHVGPLAGIALLLVLGVINQLTIACIAESVARNGDVRYGNVFFGRLVGDYLGAAGSVILTAALAVVCVAALISYYVGFATALAGATGVPPPVWVALLFSAGLYVISRESLSSTVASALLIGAVNIGLLLALAALALVHVDAAKLLHVALPFLSGQPLDPSILELVFGVILMAYFGHMSVGNCARVVLRRDPSARALVRGSVAAQMVSMLLYCLWVFAVNGAIPAATLGRESGTVLGPLAAVAGGGVHVLGAAFVILGMGMASIHYALGLFNIVRERLPARRDSVVRLARGRGTLRLMAPAERLRIGLTYLGLDAGGAQFRLDLQDGPRARRLDVTIADRLDIGVALARIATAGPAPARAIQAQAEVVEATPESACVRVTSPMSVTYEGGWDTLGLTVTDVLSRAEHERHLISWMMRPRGSDGGQRRRVGLAEAARELGTDETRARAVLERLVAEGVVRELAGDGEPRYAVRFARRRGRQLPADIWRALEPSASVAGGGDAPTPGPPARLGRWLGAVAFGPSGRRLLGLSPVVAVFLLVEWQFLTGRESFSGVLSIGGTLAASLFVGVFPALLIAASRRKGDRVPDTIIGFLGRLPFVAGIYLLFVASLLLHGLVIWSNALARAGALATAVAVLVVTAVMVARGAFRPRLVVELREEPDADGAGDGARLAFAVTAAGQPAAAEVQLIFEGEEQRHHAAVVELRASAPLHAVRVDVPPDAGAMADLKVWAHRVTPDGESEALPASVKVDSGTGPITRDLGLSGGHVLLPLAGAGCGLEITLLGT